MGQFPAGLTATLAAEFDCVGEEIMTAIPREVPAYARPLEGPFGRGVRRGVTEALHQFLTVVEAGPARVPDLAASREVYVRLGRGEVRSGRSLDNLLSAYRVGARVSWRRFGEAAARQGVDAAGLVSLAEMMFAYIDGISAASAEGYAAEQFTAAGERERRLDRLGEMLLSGSPAEAVRQVASAGCVRLPSRIAAVLIPGRNPPPLAHRSAATTAQADPSPAWPDSFADGSPPAPLWPAVLVADHPRAVQGEDTWLFVGGTDRGPARAARADRLAGLGAIVGPAVPLGQTTASAARARFARDARSGGRLPAAAGTDPLFTDEHLSALLLARDPALVADLAARLLAPLAGLPERTRERLAETLLHWLSLRGQRGLIAERLHVHPQTVRYRVNQLRELFGPCLEDPDIRFDLELVLRAAAADTRPATPEPRTATTATSTGDVAEDVDVPTLRGIVDVLDQESREKSRGTRGPGSRNPPR
ncbi:helix-turn-helix domain-containing protein [Frankia sp. AgB32]|uniref:helix-turn-helix domain-containing protein n=1 Tax=Frankia sp. AgB32 TaxID=631119 RepID=UPI00200DC3C5|nr:helix-turn-helix domain-containing protein [Frankia sp. AgB32]MCK9897417.1 helix-turn-helix domain-containing protein [Frankia sp. AgB32]